MTEDEMTGWHHQLNGHEFEQGLGDGEGQGSLVRCSPWDRKELDTTEKLNNNNGWFTLIYSRNQHNIVIILQLKINKLRKKGPD